MTPVNLGHAQLSVFPKRTDPFSKTLIKELHDLLDDYSKEEIKSDTELADVVSSLNLSLVSSHEIIEAISKLSLDCGAGTSLNLVQGLFPAGTFAHRHIETGVNSPSNVGTPSSGTKKNARLPCHIVTPHQDNPRFVGREDVLEEIDKQLPENARQITNRAVSLSVDWEGREKRK